ncbi:hypothetical protein RRG08_038013 [Elysia crispata]|uniref:Uncharacterized protein n=1 Tax=Elysia crispata TaxID=231223 RepID=A0AAE0ZZG1_9GAST|nr:hypothetical protein RRG08_038013 [Elysia crispata]
MLDSCKVHHLGLLASIVGRNFIILETTYGSIFVAWLWAIIQNRGQIHCYRVDYDEEKATLIEMFLGDLTTECTGEVAKRVTTMVCSWTTALYEEDSADWYHLTVDCELPEETTTKPSPASSTLSPSGPASSTLSPSGPTSSTLSPSGPASSTLSPSGPASSTLSPSGPASSTLSPSGPASSSLSPSGPASSTLSPSGPASSTLSPSGPASSTLSPSGPTSSTPPPSITTTSTNAPPSVSTVSTSLYTGSTLSNPTPISQSSGSSSPPMKLCPCDCAWNADAVYTDKQVQAMVDKITQELSVPSTNLSSTVRAKKSAEDNRQSAIGTGVVGLVLTGLMGGLIFSLDVLRLVRHLRQP